MAQNRICLVSYGAAPVAHESLTGFVIRKIGLLVAKSMGDLTCLDNNAPERAGVNLWQRLWF